jgi:hypothetical protein
MIKQLIKLSNELDRLGLRKEADYLDLLLKSAADRVPEMGHEEHSPSMEMPGALDAELQEDYNDAREVADMIVGGTAIIGNDADESVQDLADILGAPEHMPTVRAILGYFRNMNTMHLDKGSPLDSGKGALQARPEDDHDPFKSLSQEEADAKAREAFSQVGQTMGELERTMGGSKRERSTHQALDLRDLLES